MKEVIQRDKVMRAMWLCTDENMGMHGDLEPWTKVWVCGYCMSLMKAQVCVGRCRHVQPWTDGVDKGQGTRLGFDDI